MLIPIPPCHNFRFVPSSQKFYVLRSTRGRQTFQFIYQAKSGGRTKLKTLFCILARAVSASKSALHATLTRPRVQLVLKNASLRPEANGLCINNARAASHASFIWYLQASAHSNAGALRREHEKLLWPLTTWGLRVSRHQSGGRPWKRTAVACMGRDRLALHCTHVSGVRALKAQNPQL